MKPRYRAWDGNPETAPLDPSTEQVLWAEGEPEVPWEDATDRQYDRAEDSSVAAYYGES